jgi:methylglyoxal/glyoxal reductase
LSEHLQNGVVTIPKTTKEHRIIENASVFDFELTEEDMKRIDGLNQNHRVGPDPDNFDFYQKGMDVFKKKYEA